MQEINWNKLYPYQGDTKKSFEELCYQIVAEKFKNEILNGAILTSIDDSGGGDGVEFYLTFSNGNVYGWQAKYFCRLSKGGRKEQIKKSLQTAYKKHPKLRKWFLCSKCNFTVDEKAWFENDLANSTKNSERVLPEENNVLLIHWGESELLEYLKNYPAINKFFFSEKLLTQEWFTDRYRIDIKKSQIKAKYEAQIHIPTNIDDAINKVLGGARLVEILEKEMENQQVQMYAEDYKNAFSKLFSENVKIEYNEIQTEFRKFLNGKDKIIEHGIEQLTEIKQLILNKSEKILEKKIKGFDKYTNTLRDFLEEYYQLTESELCEPIKYIRNDPKVVPVPEKKSNENWLIAIKNYFKNIFQKNNDQKYNPPLQKKESDEIKNENRKRSEARDILFAPLYSLEEYAIPSLEWCLKVFELLEQNELHISGKAGMGKTHISFNIYEDKIINQNQPAIFVFAKDISTDRSIENQLKDYLDISTDWSFDDFLSALEIGARVNETKIPIIIDGLNESTCWDSVWKKGLENLILKIKQKYPHLVLVTTYRTSYEDQLFPNDYFDYKTNKDWWKLKEDVRGFEGLTWDAISTYFEFYKIKLDNRSNAIGYFKHPLHLKLFCETKNPDRQREIKVSFQNEDLFEVFDEYIKNSNKNITNILQTLDTKYDNSFTENKLLKLAEYIWEHNSRGMPRLEILFTNSELRVFEGENLLIFRDWNKEINKEEIQFTYDLLGGYFISKYLIKEYENSYPLIKIKTDYLLVRAIKTGLDFIIPESATNLLGRIFSNANKKLGSNKPLLRFVKSREFRKKLLNKKTEHPLFDDILRTICILFIKKVKIFLFDVLKSERVKEYSTESIFEINAQYIKENEHLVKDFLKTEFLNQGNKYYLFDLAKNIEFDAGHPLNFNFWSYLLSCLSMVERDLSWSEYVRKNHSWYGNSYFSNFVNQLENAFKENRKLSERVHLAAKKVMWVLTTNIRKLRDEATRTLYYYARKYPEEFLNLLKYSLDLNDPYVSERMLSVGYGLAMARQNDFEDKSFCKDWLPKYGKFIFNNIFSKNAKYATTHILARDYAKRTIDIALLHHPNLLLNSEINLIQYPLKNYPHKDWGESKDKDNKLYRAGNAPIHMDFGNYTIGRLIKGRRNYDSEHNEYKRVLSQIYWRIYDLGYTLEKFSNVDKKIAEEGWNYSRQEDTGKTDRYGKKYSWIAFYEMTGYRSDLGLLKGWEDEDELRVSDVDIDPSFPVELKQYDLFSELGNNNFLGDINKSADVWYDVSHDLDVNKYIRLKSKFDGDKELDWILLKGIISQKDKDDETRDVHIAVNAVLVNNKDLNKINELTKKHHDFTFDYLRNVEDHYLFEGEIPWCDLMPEHYSENLSVFYNYRDVNKSKKELKILNQGKELTKEEVSILKEIESERIFNGKIENIIPLIGGNQNNEITKKIAKEMGYTVIYIDVPFTEKDNDVLEINIETTIFQNSWESYHSEIVPSGSTETPSKVLCKKLGLFLKPQSSDMYDKNGELVSTSFKYEKGYNETSTFTYIRKDFLEKYLKNENKEIIWLLWAEKRYFSNGVKSLHSGDNGETEYRTHHKIIV